MFDRVFGAGFWGLFCLSIGAVTAGAIDGTSTMPVAAACGLIGAVAGAVRPPHVIPPEMIRADRPRRRGDVECPMCGHRTPADATACPACGEPWVV